MTISLFQSLNTFVGDRWGPRARATIFLYLFKIVEMLQKLRYIPLQYTFFGEKKNL